MMKLHTPDLTAQNIEKLAALFPICITEAKDAKTGRLKRGIAVGRMQKFLPLPTMSANIYVTSLLSASAAGRGAAPSGAAPAFFRGRRLA